MFIWIKIAWANTLLGQILLGRTSLIGQAVRGLTDLLK